MDYLDLSGRVREKIVQVCDQQEEEIIKDHLGGSLPHLLKVFILDAHNFQLIVLFKLLMCCYYLNLVKM